MIALPPVLIEALKREREAQMQYRLLHGTAYADHSLVFSQLDGKPLHGHNITQRDFRRVIKRAGIPHLRFHDLRHGS